MQAYRIHSSALAACWHLMADCTSLRSKQFAGGKRLALPGLPGRARPVGSYLHSRRRRRR